MAARAAMTGSPPGPITPGTCLPWLTVPNPTVGSLLASVLMHPPPNPASSASVVAVRFIDLPPAVGGPKIRFSAICSRQINFRLRQPRNFGQTRNNRQGRPEPPDFQFLRETIECFLPASHVLNWQFKGRLIPQLPSRYIGIVRIASEWVWATLSRLSRRTARCL